MYSSQSICIEVDWSEIKLSFIPFYSKTCGLEWIHMHPNKARFIHSKSEENYSTYILLVTEKMATDTKANDSLFN